MKNSGKIPVDIYPQNHRKGFLEIASNNPCTQCSAYCCRMLLIPHPTPTTFMDLDYILYMLGFPGIEMVLNVDGQWQVIVNQICGFLDQKTNRCTVHNTPRKPKTCVFFNPYRCWYKRNFSTENPPEIIRINLEAMEAILPYVRFDEEGNIIEIPKWEYIKESVNNVAKSQQNEKAKLPTLEPHTQEIEEKI